MSHPKLRTLAPEILLKILDGVELNVLVAIAQVRKSTFQSLFEGVLTILIFSDFESTI